MKVLVVLLIVLALAGCGRGLSKEERQAMQPLPLPDITQTATAGTDWSTNVGTATSRSGARLVPRLVSDTIYAADIDGRVRAIDATSGRVQWDRRLARPITGGVGYGEGLVLLGTPGGQVIALDARDGTDAWEAQVSSEVLVAPAAADGRVVVRSVDGRVHGLSSANGAARWEYRQDVPSLTLRGGSRPVAVRGGVLIGLPDGRLAALDLASGAPLWEVNVEFPSGRSEIERMVDIVAEPLVVQSVLYVAAFQGRLVALTLSDQRILWSRNVSTHQDMAVGGDRLFVTVEGGAVIGLDRSSGQLLWEQAGLLRRGVSAPVVIGERVLVGDADGYLHILDAATGEFTGRVRAGRDAILSRPQVHDGKVIVVDAGGRMSALRPRASGS
jgi:outer membrane protein assembly factor BamB